MILIVDNRIEKDQSTKSSLTEKLIKKVISQAIITSYETQDDAIQWNDIDCIILSGSGIRISTTPQHPKILYCLKILAKAKEKKIPTLGICFGMQIMAFSFGVKIEKRCHAINPYYEHSHYAMSKMYFNHNDCVREMPLESVEYDAKKKYIISFKYGKFMGVQWHPEGTRHGIVWLRKWIQNTQK